MAKQSAKMTRIFRLSGKPLRSDKQLSLKAILAAKRNGPVRELPTEEDAFTRAERDKLAMLDELERTGLGWFWASDADGRLTYLSAAFADRLGTAIEELLARSLLTLFLPPEDGG